MKYFRKLLLSMFFMITLFASFAFNVKAADMISIPKWDSSGNINGTIKYRNTNVEIKMPAEYIEKDSTFRAVWVSNVVNDIATYGNEAQYKAEMYRVFDTIEYYNMNAIVFHVRTHHDAMYRSSLNRLSSNYSKVDFDAFDPLEWMIGEAHRRGIEFHAWMNPYRIGSGSIESVAARFPEANPASKTYNLLKGAQNVILDPGRPEVRSFLIDTVLEVMENYDIDGIHFDDYFYESGVDDSATRAIYNTTGLSTDNFRRKQVDLFIEGLHDAMTAHNLEYGKYIQLGISPSGIYRNGSYVPANNYTYNSKGELTYPLYSNTQGFSHYDAYLFADTLKWINNEWIDYIVPQVYWAFDQTAAPFGDIVEWWNGALKNSKVNLYIGTALYTAGSASSNGWTYNPREFADEVQFASGMDSVGGQVIFAFKNLYESLRSSTGLTYQNMNNVRNEMWYNDTLLPEIRTMDRVNIGKVTGFELKRTSAGYRLDFDAMDDAKTYAIYRSTTSLNFSQSEIIKVFGKMEVNGKVSYIDEVSTSNTYYYGVRAVSKTNTPGEGVSLLTTTATTGELIPVGILPEVGIGETLFYGADLNLEWLDIRPYFGGDLTYDIYTSTDGVNFKRNTKPISLNTGVLSTTVSLGSEDKLYFYLNVKNNVSNQNSEVYEVDIKNNLGTITNFFYSGEVRAGGVITFSWSNLTSDEEITYKVQTSSNQVTWKDLTGTIKNSGFLNSMDYMLPLNYSSNYYRVVATTASGLAMSSKIQVIGYEEIKGLNLKYNGSSITGPLVLSSTGSLEIIWNNVSHSSGTVSYRALMSHDLKKWNPVKQYDQRNDFKYYESSTGVMIYSTLQYYTLYLKIEAYTNKAYAGSQIIEIRVKPGSYINSIVYNNYFYKHEAIINKTGIFK